MKDETELNVERRVGEIKIKVKRTGGRRRERKENLFQCIDHSHVELLSPLILWDVSLPPDPCAHANTSTEVTRCYNVQIYHLGEQRRITSASCLPLYSWESFGNHYSKNTFWIQWVFFHTLWMKAFIKSSYLLMQMSEFQLGRYYLSVKHLMKFCADSINTQCCLLNEAWWEGALWCS